MLKLNLQNSYDKVKFLTILQFVFVFIGFVSEALVTQSVLNFSFIFQFILLLVSYNFYYSALSNLFYSYWNMSLIFGIYYLVSYRKVFREIVFHRLQPSSGYRHENGNHIPTSGSVGNKAVKK